jgi:hypothetical protein
MEDNGQSAILLDKAVVVLIPCQNGESFFSRNDERFF